MRHPIALTRFALVAGLGLCRPAAAAEPDDLLKYIPRSVNTVAVVNVAEILATKRAEKDQWAAGDHAHYLAGAVPVHPGIDRYLVAKELSLDAPGAGEVLAVIPLKDPVNIEKFAASQRGYVDRVADEAVAVSPRGSVGVELADKVLGLARTESRQDVARWLRYAKSASISQQSRYLNAAVYNTAKRHHILVAVDLDDLFPPKQVGLVVARSEMLGKDSKTAYAVDSYLAKLVGVRFTADFKADGIDAEVRLDSNAAADAPPDVLKAFLIELLERNGAALEDLRTAAVKAEGKAVIMKFRMSDPDLARLLGVVATPAAGVADAYGVAVAPAGVTPEATRRYYRAVNKIIDDLKGQYKKAKDYGKTVVWHDTAANRIDTLSVLNVDPVVAEYGAGTAARVHAIADSLRGLPVQAAILESKAYVTAYMPRVSVLTRGGPRINPWAFSGPQSVQTNLPQIREQQAELIKKDAESRNQLWAQIDRQRSDVRRAVAEKSGFDLMAEGKP